MSKLLEIFGKGIAIDHLELVWNWLIAVLGQRQNSANTGKSLLPQILDHIANREIEQATEKLKFHLFEKPDCVLGRIAAAAVCIVKNQPQNALEQINSVYCRQPSNTMALYLMGYCCEQLGRQSQAIEFYQDCIKFKRHLQLPRQRMAAIYLSRGRFDRAIEQYSCLTAEVPEDTGSYTLLANLYLSVGDYHKAIDAFNTAIISHPDNFAAADAQDDIADLMQAGLFDKALEQVQMLMDQFGPMPDLQVRMGDIYSRSGRSDQAIHCYENALNSQPGFLEACIKLGAQLLRERQLSSAAEQFNRAAEMNDEILDAYAGLALAQSLAGQKQQTVHTLDMACSIQQNSTLLFAETAALFVQAVKNLRQNQTAEDLNKDDLIAQAVEFYRNLTKNSSSADALYKFGILMSVTGHIKKSIHYFTKSLEINPTHHRARTKLALAFCELNQHNKAVKILTETPVSASALQLHYQTAIMFCDKTRFAKAVRRIQRHIHNAMSEQDTHDNIELVLENLGLVDRAMANWSQLELNAQLAESGG